MAGVAEVAGVAAVGEWTRVCGLALAGVAVHPAEDAGAVRRAWRRIPAGTALVIVTPAAAEALGPETVAGTAPLVAVLPAAGDAAEGVPAGAREATESGEGAP